MLKLLNQRLFWYLALPIIVINGWALLQIFQYFGRIITIAVSATLLSFLLDYPVLFLQKHGGKRDRAVILVFLVALVIMLVLGVILIPLLLEQLTGFIEKLPSWLESGNKQLESFDQWASKYQLPINLTVITNKLTERLYSQLQDITGEIISFVLNMVGRIFDILITIVITFYLMLHGDRLWNGIFNWLPNHLDIHVRTSLKQNFQNYFLGQAMLACLMGVSMTLGLLFTGTPFGLLFGIGIGLMTLVPFGTALGVTIVSLLITLENFWLGIKVLIVIVLIEQAIENFVAPRILGSFTGLNPVWIVLSLLVGMQVWGVLGLLIAVPVAGFVKNTVNYLFSKSYGQEAKSEIILD
ncbi:MAG: AI-2E family transporter [Trichodesmium sp. St16_bin4-tuft]|nr:AI-2E family transporter [Trichodesmium sp. St4_bin8_1]MDE5071351.1 AI-2E family transporter [Trichodesmium sp. St5_bin8]MDE5078173.1 AI-2E family transporter [Trichodesmium sp. St2_bin6]MDE5091574.1 AI-2E family transporter [Trichodesmium sp. St18_bin3_1_1]MDE5097803.1 AI-2E family transporter [Trichodesmium sp. St16_bin4-tuft]MDE5103312.1 AI-2E family transporter [Trichodesmium sp. St19_bin2]